MSSTFDTVAEIISEICDIPRDQITPESHVTEDLGVDSLGFLDAVFSVDQRFGIRIPLEDWTQEAASENARTQFCAVKESLREGPLPVLSGASGVAPTTEEELAFLEGLAPQGFQPAVRAYGSLLGHGIEAHFPLGVALAALALRHGSFYPSFASPEIERESRSGRSRSWSPPGATGAARRWRS